MFRNKCLLINNGKETGLCFSNLEEPLITSCGFNFCGQWVDVNIGEQELIEWKKSELDFRLGRCSKI